LQRDEKRKNKESNKRWPSLRKLLSSGKEWNNGRKKRKKKIRDEGI